MRIQMEDKARGVAPDAAVAWWSDFREGAVDHAFLPGARRRILRRDGADVTMEDEMGVGPVRLFHERARATTDGRAVRFSGTNSFGSFEGAYLFGEAPEGTAIRLEATVRLRKGLRWSDAAAKPLAELALRHDLRQHAAAMERDLGTGRDKKSP